ncbi:hypothetical protein [Pseudoclavibacter sp. AY1H1]|uniref:hypothetical protein n=1 Tax=Pseudoclavibacter sp. AY1H1 TaxID=2080584 RepID=UPI000CE804DF|nr:hypothetical protein [Pseudoclavibacter sp. AY1H1]PPF39958.1 hypothetical protein C5E05_01730 [Pseudoclavibacter sp. AY1H1]
MAEQEYTPTEAEGERIEEAASRLRHYGYGHLAEAVERLAEVRANERAKRPDREQVARTLFLVDNPDCPPDRIHESTLWATLRDDYLSSADAVLALEPEAREEPGTAAVRALHHRTEVEVVESDCMQDACDHSEGCPTSLQAVCAHCFSPGGDDRHDDYRVVREWHEWPCWTIKALGGDSTPEAREVTDAEVEAAARVMFDGDLEPGGTAEYTWAEMVVEDKSRADIWRADARAALEAARGVSRG